MHVRKTYNRNRPRFLKVLSASPSKATSPSRPSWQAGFAPEWAVFRPESYVRFAQYLAREQTDRSRPLCTGPNYAQGRHSRQSSGRMLIGLLTGQVALDLSIVWRGGLGADCPSSTRFQQSDAKSAPLAPTRRRVGAATMRSRVGPRPGFGSGRLSNCA